MNITIVGAGNGGTAVAADLALKGHNVTLLKTSQVIYCSHFQHIIDHDYQINTTKDGRTRTATIRLATYDADLALRDAELVIIYIQTNYHEALAARIGPYLSDKIVLLEPGYLGTLYFQQHCSRETIFIEAESSPIDCRITADGEVACLFENVRNPIGIYPSSATDATIDKLGALDYRFVLTDSIVESALHNPNLIVHTIGAFMSIPRIEYTKGDYWMYREVFVPSVWNLALALDDEKMNVMEKLGLERLPYVNACKQRNSLDAAADPTEVFFDYAENHSPKGPSVSNSRYLTEDVPQGLCLLESIGLHVGVPTPICSSVISMSGKALGIDFRTYGRTIERLGRGRFEAVLNDIPRTRIASRRKNVP